MQYAPSLSDDKDVLSSPNNILGIEYLKALMSRNSKIVPFTTTRVGADYHDKRLGTNQCSAIASHPVRKLPGMIFTYHPASKCPENTYEILQASLEDRSLCLQTGFTHAIQAADRMLGRFTTSIRIFLGISHLYRNTLPSSTHYLISCDLLKNRDTSLLTSADVCSIFC